jgi:hypothetical protein
LAIAPAQVKLRKLSCFDTGKSASSRYTACVIDVAIVEAVLSVDSRRHHIPDRMAKEYRRRSDFVAEAVGLERGEEKDLLPARW